jgi:hypothetical protein
MTGLSYPDGSIHPFTPMPEHLRGRVWAVVREAIDDLVAYLARSNNPMVARWGQRLRDGDRG